MGTQSSSVVLKYQKGISISVIEHSVEHSVARSVEHSIVRDGDSLGLID